MRKLMVGSAALAAAFALVGCAPAGYNPADYGGGGAAPAPVANTQQDTPSTKAPATKAPAGGDERTPQLSTALTTDSLTAAKVKKMGDTVQNEKGFVLYRFDGDTAGSRPVATCNGDCARTWLPALTNEGVKPTLKGIDAKLVGTVTRADGTEQLTLKGWPLYSYIGDKVPGTWKGQNVNGKWFVIKSDGTKNLTCLPAISKPVAPPKASGGGTSGDAGSDYSY